MRIDILKGTIRRINPENKKLKRKNGIIRFVIDMLLVYKQE